MHYLDQYFVSYPSHIPQEIYPLIIDCLLNLSPLLYIDFFLAFTISNFISFAQSLIYSQNSLKSPVE